MLTEPGKKRTQMFSIKQRWGLTTQNSMSDHSWRLNHLQDARRDFCGWSRLYQTPGRQKRAVLEGFCEAPCLPCWVCLNLSKGKHQDAILAVLYRHHMTLRLCQFWDVSLSYTLTRADVAKETCHILLERCSLDVHPWKVEWFWRATAQRCGRPSWFRGNRRLHVEERDSREILPLIQLSTFYITLFCYKWVTMFSMEYIQFSSF